MSSRHLVLAALLGGLLTASASATPQVAPDAFAPPAPARVVAPTGLSRSYLGAIVMLRLTVDATGRPHNIRVLSGWDRAPSERLVAAVSQWQFTPARRNGVAVSSKIALPLELIED